MIYDLSTGITALMVMQPRKKPCATMMNNMEATGEQASMSGEMRVDTKTSTNGRVEANAEVHSAQCTYHRALFDLPVKCP